MVNKLSLLNHPSDAYASSTLFFKEGLPLLALFEKEGGSIASAIETGDLIYQNGSITKKTSNPKKIVLILTTQNNLAFQPIK